MTPGDYKRRGEGLEMAYGFHASPVRRGPADCHRSGVAGLAFVDEDKGQTREDALADMMQRWPKAHYVEARRRLRPHARQIFASEWSGDQPVRLVMIGTDFDVRVWETLLKIPMGRAVSYTDIARHIGAPSASRAVGSGRRPQSALVRGALPPRAARRRQPRRLPLGPHAQARADRLGDGRVAATRA
jgi:AraC family transcriptional regulator of adaptative response/methylated-DNA-[protein]-cysteine methyltransferase